MPYLQVNDINMYYEECGSGAPLILMHGATGCINASGGWSGLVGLFSQKYRTIHVEYRGHGRTNNPRDYISYALVAEDICKFIELLDIGPAHIAGISDGAIVTLHIGMTRPELAHTLICLGANYYNDDQVRQANLELNVEKIERKTPELALELADAHDRNKQSGYWRTLVNQVEKNLAINPNYSLEDLQKISTPTLLLSGEDDLWANRKQMCEMRENIPNSEMLIINNAGHTIQYSHPHIVGPVVMDFLERYTYS